MRTDDLRTRLKRIPPFLAYALATHGHGPHSRHITRRRLSELSGLTVCEVRRISRSATWRDVRVFKMLAFLDACGIDLCHMHRTAQKLKRHRESTNPFRHLTREQFHALVRRIETYQISCQT